MKITCFKKRENGFTLIELLIVICVVGILSSIAIPSYFKYLDKAKIIAAVSIFDSVRKDLQNYANENGNYPTMIAFNGFLDQDGSSILETASMDSLEETFSSLENYSFDEETGEYALKAKAKDSRRTVVTLTPRGTVY